MNKSPRISVLYLVEADRGGIAEYVVAHAQSLKEAGLDVTLLCRPGFPVERVAQVRCKALLPARRGKASRLISLINQVRDCRQIARAVEEEMMNGDYAYVLMDCFREYFAPLWVGPFKRLARQGVLFGVITHDPVRDFVVGPLWWHRYSIRQAYSFIHDIFLHDAREIDFGGTRPEQVRIHEIPHGPYIYPPPGKTREQMRGELAIGKDDLVILSFGQIRDGKNLDLFIEALREMPDGVTLVVAGQGASASSKPPSHYQELAEREGVSEKCRWCIRYIKDDEITDFFEMSDAILLTYSRAFRSASGVLQIAVEHERPVLASGGSGPLKTAIQSYPIGLWISDLSPVTIREAVGKLHEKQLAFEFSRYRVNHSWAKNASIIREAITDALP